VKPKNWARCTFQESADGRKVTATFDFRGLKKEDIHVSFQRNRLIVTWQAQSVVERGGNGRLAHESRVDKNYRTIPLPEGTKVRIDSHAVQSVDSEPGNDIV
jgi:HSP20 family molecular chaperone IbpA